MFPFPHTHFEHLAKYFEYKFSKIYTQSRRQIMMTRFGLSVHTLPNLFSAKG